MTYSDDFRPSERGLMMAVRTLLRELHEPGRPHVDPATAAAGLPDEPPEEGLGGEAALRALSPVAFADVSRLDHPGFFAHMDPPTPWHAWAAALWAAATNQNLLHPDTAPAARALESRLLGWLAPKFGMDGGHFVPGATVANITALWAARELTGADQVVASSAAHLSVEKAARLLGMSYLELPVDGEQRIRADLLPDDLRRSILVLTAGTVGTGSVDDLTTGAGAAWRHIDAAWAGALMLSSHSEVLDGLELADSVGVSLHKWLFQPKGSAVVMFAEADRAHRALTFGGSYLAAPNVGLLGSRGASVLPLATSLLAWGTKGIGARIDSCMTAAASLADLIAADPALVLWRRPLTGVVNWRPAEHDAMAVRSRLEDAWVSTADIGGQRWFRSVAANPCADPATVVRAVRDAMTSHQ
ncbi:pyridoxal phosphate-dependent decarboxylase family protein [Streptomyces sp. NPDC018955]|uniref:pyridoxal phosphate-dependent decarboxylase family protein n=1 Tax=Streptomyces sp. NPDC018955 TaxID=3365055 RepID=UPI0037A15F8E